MPPMRAGPRGRRSASSTASPSSSRTTSSASACPPRSGRWPWSGPRLSVMHPWSPACVRLGWSSWLPRTSRSGPTSVGGTPRAGGRGWAGSRTTRGGPGTRPAAPRRAQELPWRLGTRPWLWAPRRTARSPAPRRCVESWASSPPSARSRSRGSRRSRPAMTRRARWGAAWPTSAPCSRCWQVSRSRPSRTRTGRAAGATSWASRGPGCRATRPPTRCSPTRSSPSGRPG